jgi:hypothetical protein
MTCSCPFRDKAQRGSECWSSSTRSRNCASGSKYRDTIKLQTICVDMKIAVISGEEEGAGSECKNETATDKFAGSLRLGLNAPCNKDGTIT